MLNEKGVRELAYVVKVDNVDPIEGYDRIELAHIGGWTCVVPKGQFGPGSLGVYFEIDSKVPETETFNFCSKYKYHIKTQKMCKGAVLSQGLLMSFETLGIKERPEGTFLTEELKVTYYEKEDNKRKEDLSRYQSMKSRHDKLFKKWPFNKMMQTQLGRKVLFLIFGKKRDKKSDWPSWVIKTDEERCQNLNWVNNYANTGPWIVTEKIDGSSTTFTMKRRKPLLTCSRNVVFDKPDKKCYYDTNIYTEIGSRYNMEEVLKSLLKEYPKEDWITIQGETFGRKVQSRDYHLDGIDFRAFNLIFSTKGRLNSKEAEKILEPYGIRWVPILGEITLPGTVQEMLEYADGASVIDGDIREGVVLRSLDGTKSFKAVSNKYLLTRGE